MAKKEKGKGPIFDITEKKHNVTVLQQTNRIKEAIAYTFLMFTEVLKQKYGPKVWRPSITMRELAIRLVKHRQVHMDPEKIYPFITHLEQVLYGGEPITEAMLEETTQYFDNIYKVIQSSAISAVDDVDIPSVID